MTASPRTKGTAPATPQTRRPGRQRTKITEPTARKSEQPERPVEDKDQRRCRRDRHAWHAWHAAPALHVVSGEGNEDGRGHAIDESNREQWYGRGLQHLAPCALQLARLLRPNPAKPGRIADQGNRAHERENQPGGLPRDTRQRHDKRRTPCGVPHH